MKKISSSEIIRWTGKLAQQINRHLAPEVKRLIRRALNTETGYYSRLYLKTVLKNINRAEKENLPICQDTGLVIVFVEAGPEVCFQLENCQNIEEAINKGVAAGYQAGYLRKSVVDPLTRKNTWTNTPAVVHFLPAQGDTFRITLLAKGFGSENTSRLKMLNPAEGKEGIEKFILETVQEAGPNSCPPVFLGIGIGGSLEKAALLSKMALAGVAGEKKSVKIQAWEKEILKKINSLGIGPAGWAGKTTALNVKIRLFPTHIAGLPVAISINCWAHRLGKIEL